MALIQLDFLKADDISRIDTEILEMRGSTDKLRKSLFSRFSELKKMYEELKNEHEHLKKAMCRQKELF